MSPFTVNVMNSVPILTRRARFLAFAIESVAEDRSETLDTALADEQPTKN